MLPIRLNKSDYIIIAIYSFIFLVVNCYDFVTSYDSTKYIFPDGHSTQNTFPPLKGYLIAIPIELLCTLLLVFLFILWLIPKYLINHKNYTVFFILTLICTIGLGVMTHATWHWSENKPWQVYPDFFEMLLNGLGLSAENSGLLLAILLSKKYYEGQLQILEVQKQQQESELKLLQAQLNPHFLFNNLNTLDALIDGTEIKAKKFIANLSSLYRYLIESKDRELMPLAEELAMVENYFYLIETRFGGAYTFSIVKNGNWERGFVPTGALQLLIENVIKHNSIMGKDTIHTKIEINDSKIEVKNPKGTVRTNVVSFGTGLQNLTERYRLLFDEPIAIENQESFFKVTIPIINLNGTYE